MALDRAFENLAVRLQESATALSQSDVRARLSDALNDIYHGTGHYCYLMDVYGDDQSGDVVYCCDGDYRKAGYTLGSVGDKAATAEIDTDNAIDVVPRTVYDEEADEADHMAAMEAARADRLYTDGAVPLCERFVSKSERSKMSADDFAGKGKSFPISKAADVMAAVRSLGRAGSGNYSADTIKANIKRIAKRKGFPLPKAWQDESDSQESMREAGRQLIEVGARNSAADQEKIQAVHDHSVALGAACSMGKESTTGLALVSGEVPLRESAAFCAPVEVRESSAAANIPIRIITPGWGSSGYYSPQLLERDGPKIFKAGTQMFWDHATDAEESARPEGRMDDLAAVTTSDARWEAAGKEGPGLYAEAKVFSDYADKIREKAKYTGLSIRAGGQAREGEAEGRKGLIIESLTRAQSIDFVTKPGRGGQALIESARAGSETTQQEEADAMDAAEAKKLQESHAALEARVRKLNERAAVADAADEIRQYFMTVRVGEAVQERVTRRVLSAQVPLLESGELDRAKLKTLVEAETKDECEYISRVTGRQVVVNMGGGASGQQHQISEADRRAQEAEREERESQYAGMMGFPEDRKAGRRILERGVVAFDPTYNARVARGAKPTLETSASLEVA